MGAALVFEGPRKIGFVAEPDAPLGADEVRLETLFSGISTGTELTAYRGTNPYLHKRWDPDARLFVTGGEQPSYPLVGWGYEEVGQIVEVGAEVTDLEVGQRIFGIWGHREGKVVPAAYARTRILPPHVPAIHGIFCRIGEIALNAIHDSQMNLGETVAIWGMGVIGQVTAQLARLAGARVIAVDMVPERLDLAHKLGADVVLDAREGSPAERVKHLTDGRGADATIEISGSTAALHEAIRACAYSSRVVAVGFYQGEGRGLFLGEEFHHNRIDLVCSQISGVNPSLRHRWDKDRLGSAFMGLVAAGKVELQPLITHVVAFREAAAAFELLDTDPSKVMQAVLAFEGAK